VRRTTRNGVDTIEHGIYLDGEGIDLLLETDGTLVPTLAVLHRILENAEEATLYVEEVGMSEMDAIKAATSAAAETLKQPAVGAVEPERYADLLVVDSDPLTDINVLLEEPTAVYKSGDPAPAAI